MNPPPSRPSWRKKRWALALAALLLLAYPACAGPVMYAAVRGWISVSTHTALKETLYLPLYSLPGAGADDTLFESYLLWRFALAWSHDEVLSE